MADQEMKFEIAMVKPRFLLGEPVFVRSYLFNFGEEMINVNARMAASPGTSGEIVFDLSGASGRKIPFSARINIGKPEVEHFVNVLPYSGVGRQTEISFFYPLRKAGKYTLKARYTNHWDGSEFGLETWTGSLDSNEVTFELVRPGAAEPGE
jgi:hypothetical protein